MSASSAVGVMKKSATTRKGTFFKASLTCLALARLTTGLVEMRKTASTG